MRQARIWIGTAISVLFVVWLFRSVNVDDLLTALRQIRLPSIAAGLVIFAASIAVRILRWQTILAEVLALPFSEAGALLVIGAAANNILPARGGEVVRAALVRERHGTSMFTVLGTILVERVFDVLALVSMLSITLVFLPSNDVFLRGAILVGAIACAVALGLVAVAVRPALVKRLIERVIGVLPAVIRQRIAPLAERVLDGLRISSPGRWAFVAITSVATWMLEGTAYLMVGTAFGFHLNPAIYYAICGAANLSVAVPSTSGGIGPYESITKAALTTLAGVNASAATAYALVLHVFVLVPVIVLGVVLLWRRNLSLGSLSQASAAEASTDAAADMPDMGVPR